MKSLALVLLVAATVAAAPEGWPGFPRRSLQKRDSTANINDYMDRVLDQTRIFLKNNNLDPYALTDHYLVNFTFKDLLGIKWKTSVGLYDGQASDLVTIARSGDASLSYTSDARTLDLQAPVTFNDIKITFDYDGKVLNIGPSGTVTVTVKNLKASLDVAVNILKFNATLKSFSIDSAKSIVTDVKGLGLLGNLKAELFINAFTFVLKNQILNVVEAQVKHALQAGIASTDAGPVVISVTGNNSASGSGGSSR